MKYNFGRSPIQAVLTSSEDCQALMENIKKETEGMIEELNKVKTEFLAQENHSKNNKVKTFRKGNDIYVKVEDIVSIMNRILKENAFLEVPKTSAISNEDIIPLAKLGEETVLNNLLRELQCRK